jgi:putative ABC transport system permease protein
MKLRSIIPTETISIALQTIRAHKLRSFLTVLGIVVGVVVVVAVASILTGLRGRIIEMIEEYGTNNIYAYHLSTGAQSAEREKDEAGRQPLTAADADAIRMRAPAVQEVANVSYLWRVDKMIKHRGQTYKEGRLQAVSASYANVVNLSLQEGRFISETDDVHRRDVMVIGINVAEAIFPDYSSIVGEQVELAGKSFEIIGTVEKRKSSLFGQNEEDNAIFIPFGTGLKLAPMSKELNLHIRARTGMMAAALDEIEQILRLRRGVKYSEPNNFSLTTADQMVEQFDDITMYAGLFAIAISAVGLLVGGIGVMNIMLVSVTERAREIGIRKAVGARKQDIVRQFLFEAMTLTGLGGALGVILAIFISYVIMLFLPELPASIPIWAVVTGMSVSIGVGLVFGVWPAKKAANLDPIECLRYE